MKQALTALLFLTSVSGVVAAQHQHEHAGTPPERLGTVHVETTCAASVQPTFDRAVALLHSFWFSAARDAFGAVLEKDPSCAIAYWGIGLTHYSNPFGGFRPPEALAKGRDAVAKGLALGPKSARERDYLSAVAELFRDFETRDARTRALAYEQAMARTAKAWPDDAEATIFYALALAHTAVPTDKTYANQLKAGALLEPLFAKQPDHPGLAHYIIHAYDVPPLAPKALAAARRYAQIAPSAPHALHMPSHTFTRVGAWDESIATNIASADAAKREGAATEQLHAMDYMVYAYLQSARDDAARRLVAAVDAIVGSVASAPSNAAPVPAGYFAAAAMPARYVLERGAWSEAASLPVRPAQFAHVRAITHFARAIGSARAGDAGAAEAETRKLAELEAELTKAGEAYWAEQVALQRIVAGAWLSQARGDSAQAVRELRAAAEREDATEKSAVTPGPFVPARESLGDLLLVLEQPAEALAAYERNLTKEPNRLRTLFGAARAAEASGNREKARKYYEQVMSLCEKTDTPDRAEVRAARAFLGEPSAVR